MHCMSRWRVLSCIHVHMLARRSTSHKKVCKNGAEIWILTGMLVHCVLICKCWSCFSSNLKWHTSTYPPDFFNSRFLCCIHIQLWFCLANAPRKSRSKHHYHYQGLFTTSEEQHQIAQSGGFYFLMGFWHYCLTKNIGQTKLITLPLMHHLRVVPGIRPTQNRSEDAGQLNVHLLDGECKQRQRVNGCMEMGGFYSIK